jgi:hypothetical protein
MLAFSDALLLIQFFANSCQANYQIRTNSSINAQHGGIRLIFYLLEDLNKENACLHCDTACKVKLISFKIIA